MSLDHEFNKIYKEYYPRILQYLIKIAGPLEAEDIAQDVFKKIYKGLPGFAHHSKLSTWIYRIATNAVIDRSRSAAYKQKANQVDIEEDADRVSQSAEENHPSPATDQVVIQKEMRDCVNEYIDTLPPEYKVVIVLSELEGLANKEIAEVLDISLDNVKIRLHRARAKLKTILKDACEFYYTEENTLACDRKQISILPKV